MKRILVTNNKKVEYRYSGKVEINMLNNESLLNVLYAGKELAEKGARLLIDPSRTKCRYKSLLFFFDENQTTPDKNTIQMIEKSISDAKNMNLSNITEKESLLSGIYENKDLNIIKKVLN